MSTEPMRSFVSQSEAKSLFADFTQSGVVRRNVSIDASIQAALQNEIRIMDDAGATDIFTLAYKLCSCPETKFTLVGVEGIAALPWIAYLGGWSELEPRRSGFRIQEEKILSLVANRTITLHIILPFFYQTERIVCAVDGVWFPTSTEKKHSMASSLAVLGSVLNINRTTRRKLSRHAFGAPYLRCRLSGLAPFERRILRSAKNVVGTRFGVSYPAHSWTYLSPSVIQTLPPSSQYRSLNWRQWKRRNHMTWDDWKELGAIRVDFKVHRELKNET